MVRLWDVKTKEPAAGSPLTGSAPVAFAPCGRTLAMCGPDVTTVTLWDLGGDRPRETATLAGHLGRVGALAFAPDGRTLASLSGGMGVIGKDENGIRIWDLSGEKPRERSAFRWPDHYIRNLRALAFAPDGRVLASENPEGAVQLWDLRDGRLQERAVLKADALRVTGLAFAPDGRRLATAYCPGWFQSARGSRVIMWDADGRKLQEWQFPGRVNGVAFAPDGHHLATANSNGTVYIVRLRRGGTP
jgi:WD40 repeat protein